MPKAIDIAEFTRLAKTLAGDVAVTDLSRLRDLIVTGEARLHFELHGGHTSRREPRIACTIQGLVTLQCQRCLQPFDQPLDIHSTLVFVAAESMLPAIEEEDESVDYVVAETLDVMALIEDEVILALPLVPRHDSGLCQESVGHASTAGKSSPFAAIARLKQ